MYSSCTTSVWFLKSVWRNPSVGMEITFNGAYLIVSINGCVTRIPTNRVTTDDVQALFGEPTHRAMPLNTFTIRIDGDEWRVETIGKIEDFVDYTAHGRSSDPLNAALLNMVVFKAVLYRANRLIDIAHDMNNAACTHYPRYSLGLTSEGLSAEELNYLAVYRDIYRWKCCA
jgi:hypothetical protein